MRRLRFSLVCLAVVASACGRTNFVDVGVESTTSFTDTGDSITSVGPTESDVTTSADSFEVGPEESAEWGSSYDEGPEWGSSYDEAEWGSSYDSGPEWGSSFESGEWGSSFSASADEAEWGSSFESGEWGSSFTDSADTTWGEEGPTTDTGVELGPCCEVGQGPSCEDFAVAECVCSQDSYCCETFWDDLCVQEVTTLGCGMCEGGETSVTDTAVTTDTFTTDETDTFTDTTDTFPTDATDTFTDTTDTATDTSDTGVEPGPCCEASPVPSCEEPDVAQCVCQQDSFCCEVEWDGICVDEVTSLGCGECGGTTTSLTATADSGPTDSATDSFETGDAGTSDTGAEGACCEPHGGPACEEPDVAACVCDAAPSCCFDSWSAACVDLVDTLGCGFCGGSDSGGGLPDGAPCGFNAECEGGLCWSEGIPPVATCRSECIPTNAPFGLFCDNDVDCCSGFCQVFGSAGLGQCQ